MHLNRLVIWAIIGTGISSVVTQLLTIREFLTQFHGNEITISLVVFCWLLITAMGTLAAKVVKPNSTAGYGFMALSLGVWPLIQIIGIRGFREHFFTHGVAPGFYPILFYILITITPYCLLAGFFLPQSQYLLNRKGHPFDSGRLYVTDSIGDIIGGLLFSFVLVYWFKPFQIISVASLLLILAGILILWKQRSMTPIAAGLVIALGFYAVSLNSPFERWTLSDQYGQIVRYMESPYGRIVISKEGPQYTLWESGVPLYWASDMASSEEKIHYPLSQLPRVNDLLLISGGLGSTLKEAAKYNPSQVDYLELDPRLTAAASQVGLIKEAPFLNVIHEDARHYMRMTDKHYDAVIMDLPEPETFQVNRFFTEAFFALVKKALRKGGVFSFSMRYSPNYMSEVQRKKLSTVFNTARTQFKHVKLIPGEKAYFLMSDRPLSMNIPKLLKEMKISTVFIRGFYQGNITQERINTIQEGLDWKEPINTDFEPRLMNIAFMEWFSKHDSTPWVFIFALAGITLVYLIFIRWEEYVLFSTGFVTMGMEMLVIFSFQVIYGYIYLKIGAMVTAFLIGLLPGALAGQQWQAGTRFKILISDGLILLMSFGFFLWLFGVRFEAQPWHLLLFSFIFSFFCGFQFPVVTNIIGEKQSPAAGCLGADLWGAAVGTIATGTVLIPLMGMKYAIFALFFVKISSSMLIFLKYPAHFRR